MQPVLRMTESPIWQCALTNAPAAMTRLLPSDSLRATCADGWMGLAGIINASVIDGWVIDTPGTPDQKDRFLPGLASGATQGAFTITEPNAGSDAQAIRTAGSVGKSALRLTYCIERLYRGLPR